MAAPRRLRVEVGDFSYSAYLLSPLAVLPDERPVCKTCSPKRTKMMHVATLRFTLKDGFEVYNVWHCQTCETFWATQWLEEKAGA